MEKGKKKKKNYFQSHTTPSKLLPLKQKATSIETGGGGSLVKMKLHPISAIMIKKIGLALWWR